MTKKDTLAENRKAGAEWNREVASKIKSGEFWQEVTIQPLDSTGKGALKDNGEPLEVRMDLVRVKNGKIVLMELKNGPTAPLTPNQKKAFPLIEQNGFIDKSGKLKDMLVDGRCGPTKVRTVRPENNKRWMPSDIELARLCEDNTNLTNLLGEDADAPGKLWFEQGMGNGLRLTWPVEFVQGKPVAFSNIRLAPKDALMSPSIPPARVANPNKGSSVTMLGKHTPSAAPDALGPVSPWTMLAFAAAGYCGGKSGAQLVESWMSDYFNRKLNEAERAGLTIGEALSGIIAPAAGMKIGILVFKQTASLGVLKSGLAATLSAAATGFVVGIAVTGVAALVGWAVGKVRASRKLLEDTRREMAMLRQIISASVANLGDRLNSLCDDLDSVEKVIAYAEQTLEEYAKDPRDQDNALLMQAFVELQLAIKQLEVLHCDLVKLSKDAAAMAHDSALAAKKLSDQAYSARSSANEDFDKRDDCLVASAGTTAIAGFLGALFPLSLLVTAPAAMGFGVGVVANDDSANNHRSRAEELQSAADVAAKASKDAHDTEEKAKIVLRRCEGLQSKGIALAREYGTQLFPKSNL